VRCEVWLHNCYCPLTLMCLFSSCLVLLIWPIWWQSNDLMLNGWRRTVWDVISLRIFSHVITSCVYVTWLVCNDVIGWFRENISSYTHQSPAVSGGHLKNSSRRLSCLGLYNTYWGHMSKCLAACWHNATPIKYVKGAVQLVYKRYGVCEKLVAVILGDI